MWAHFKRLDDWIAAAAIGVIVILTIASVLMRYLFNHPFYWTEETTTTLFFWAIMIGSVSAMKERMHISIDAFTSFLSPLNQNRVQVFNDLVAAVVLAVFGILGLQLALGASGKILPILGLSYVWIDIAIPVSAFWMVCYLLVHMRQDIEALQGTNARQVEDKQ